MADTKTLRFYEFFYPDRRPDSTSAFASNGFIIDEEAGDKAEVITDNGEVFWRFTRADGKVALVPRDWLWTEAYSRTVRKGEKPTVIT